MPERPAALGQLGQDWEERASGLPRPGPARWWVGAAGIALDGRLGPLRAGLAALEGHPGAPGVVADLGEVLVLEPLAPAVDPLAAIIEWSAGEPWHMKGTRRGAMDALGARVRPHKALRALGVKTRHIDRFLDSPVELRSVRGPCAEALTPAWIRQGAAGPVLLKLRGARSDGFPALSLVATDGELGSDLSAGHTQTPAHAAFIDFAAFYLDLHAAALGHDEDAAERLRERLRPDADVPVQIAIQARPWVRALLEPGTPVTPTEARRVHHAAHGRSIDGERVRVELTPPIRVGQRPSPREPRSVRDARLFSRWHQGVQVDDEGRLSLTPEALALDFAAPLRGRVMDGTCGVGGITIALARSPGITHVVAVDMNPGRLAMARHNAGLYGVDSKISFQAGDILDHLPDPRLDALVLDPPWGGRSYDRERLGLEDLPFPLAEVLERAPPRVRLKLPPSFVLSTLPGPWTPSLARDARGRIKFVVADRC